MSPIRKQAVKKRANPTIDVFLDDDKLVFIVYGQGYEYKGEYSLVTPQITVSPAGKLGKNVNFKISEETII